jgi:RsiW-degrading membrane proteinase PrsW (M82 family)
MEYKFNCTSCGQHIWTTSELVGSRENCPSCAAELIAPPPEGESASTPPQSPDFNEIHQKALRYVLRIINTGRSSSLVTDFRELDFKAEVLPLNEQSFALLKSDFVFWSVTLLAIVPLFLVTLNETQSQLTGFCLFFAAIWGLVFKKFVVEEPGGWRLPLFSLFFTGLIGMNLLLQLYKWFPDSYTNLSNSKNSFYSLAGYVFQVGLWEEFCKIVPVLFYLAWKRCDARPLTIILIGVFSGLGFAAFENLGYADMQIVRSAVLTKKEGIQGLKEGVQGAMVNVMLRSMSNVFGHAVYSGIFAYFIAVGWLTRRRRLALALVGLGVAALIHGLYDWFWGVQMTLPALITAFGFMLFYAYLTKLRLLMAPIPETPNPAAPAT